jgi:hypothetical protein
LGQKAHRVWGVRPLPCHCGEGWGTRHAAGIARPCRLPVTPTARSGRCRPAGSPGGQSLRGTARSTRTARASPRTSGTRSAVPPVGDSELHRLRPVADLCEDAAACARDAHQFFDGRTLVVQHQCLGLEVRWEFLNPEPLLRFLLRHARRDERLHPLSEVREGVLSPCPASSLRARCGPRERGSRAHTRGETSPPTEAMSSARTAFSSASLCGCPCLQLRWPRTIYRPTSFPAPPPHHPT